MNSDAERERAGVSNAVRNVGPVHSLAGIGVMSACWGGIIYLLWKLLAARCENSLFSSAIKKSFPNNDFLLLSG